MNPIHPLSDVSCLVISRREYEDSGDWFGHFAIVFLRANSGTNPIRRLTHGNLLELTQKPALFVTADLVEDQADFESLYEDTHMSRAFDLRELRQGIGTPIVFRYCEDNWSENASRKGSLIKHFLEYRSSGR